MLAGALGSTWGTSRRWEETQPLSEPVDPDRQREEPELPVAETQETPAVMMSSQDCHMAPSSNHSVTARPLEVFGSS